MRLCRLPMKSHSNASPQRSRLAARSSSRFSPTRETPASATAPISSSGTYLQASSTSTFGPASSRTASSRRRTSSGSIPRIGSTISPSPAPRRPVDRSAARPRGGRRTGPGCSDVQRSLASTRSTPARSSRRVATAGRSSIRLLGEPVPKRRERCEHLVADLVAAGSDPRADDGGRGLGRLRGPPGDPGGEAAPASVDHRHARRDPRARSEGSRRRTPGRPVRPRRSRARRPRVGPAPVPARTRPPAGRRDGPDRRRAPAARSPPGRARARAPRRGGGGCSAPSRSRRRSGRPG